MNFLLINQILITSLISAFPSKSSSFYVSLFYEDHSTICSLSLCFSFLLSLSIFHLVIVFLVSIPPLPSLSLSPSFRSPFPLYPPHIAPLFDQPIVSFLSHSLILSFQLARTGTCGYTVYTKMCSSVADTHPDY